MSDLFHAAIEQEPMTLPVSAEASIWILSGRQAAWNLIHALHCDIEDGRSLTCPALHVTIGELVQQMFSDAAKVHHAPDPELQRLFGSQPALTTPLATEAGFQSDDSLEALIASVFASIRAQAPLSPDSTARRHGRITEEEFRHESTKPDDRRIAIDAPMPELLEAYQRRFEWRRQELEWRHGGEDGSDRMRHGRNEVGPGHKQRYAHEVGRLKLDTAGQSELLYSNFHQFLAPSLLRHQDMAHVQELLEKARLRRQDDPCARCS
ncbi:hypothetical protein ACFSUK_17535 [Sphingobium scionense]